MPDIMHRVTISAAPERVFDALATAEGVRSWWTRVADLDAGLGGTGEFRLYGGSKVAKVEVGELSRPGRVSWKVLASFRAEWIGTSIVFDLRPAGNGAKLQFVH